MPGTVHRRSDGARAAGAFDPLIGRGPEVARALQILGRRHKNSPVLVGDAGVGKTAIVEGIACRIAAGEVPAMFRGMRIIALDLGALLAGTRFRGDFEERIQGRDRRATANAATRSCSSTNPHRHRRRRHLGGYHGRLQPAQAGARQRRAALHRGHHIRGVPPPLREGHALSRRFQKIVVAEPSVMTPC